MKKLELNEVKMEQKMYTTIKASELLGIKVRTVREWIRAGKIKAQKYDASNRWFISESEIKRLRNGQKSGDSRM